MSKVTNAMTAATKWLGPLFNFIGVSVLITDPERSVISINPDDAVMVIIPQGKSYKFVRIDPSNMDSISLPVIDFTQWIFSTDDPEVKNCFGLMTILYEDHISKDLPKK